MKLYLVQHAEACAKDVDPARPLTKRGRKDTKRLATMLKGAGVRAERVMHSGKLRARQTAARLAKAIAPGVEPEESGLLGPGDNPASFDWQSESWDRDTLIVGHLPFMTRLVSHLAADDAEQQIVAFEPGTAVCLERDDGRWRIAWMLRPSLLRKRRE